MRKSMLAILMILSIVISQFTAVNAERKQYLEPEVLFECDFESGLEPAAGNYTTNKNISSADYEGRKVMKANSKSGNAQLVVYTEEPQTCEATLISMDMLFDVKTCRAYMDVFTPVEGGGEPSFDMNETYRSLYVTEDGRISYFQSFAPPSGSAVRNSYYYNVNEWYHYDMWIEYESRTVYYFVNGVEVGTMPLDDKFTALGGFRMTVESRNGGAEFLFDNLRVVSFPKRGAKVPYENVGVPDNFENPIKLEYKTDEHNLGYIFWDKNVELTATLTNVLDDTMNITVETTVTDEDSRILTTYAEQHTLEYKEEAKTTTSVRVDKYGFYYIETKVKETETNEILSQSKFQFSVARPNPEGLKNTKLGLVDHTQNGHGIDEGRRKFELFRNAGIGGFRIEYNMPRTSYQDGTYILLDEYGLPASLENAVATDMDQIVLLTHGTIVPVTEEGIAEWEKYVESVVSQILAKKKPGQTMRYEIWNEYNLSSFNINEEPPEAYVNLLKVTYPIIKRLDPDAEVWGLAAAPTNVPTHKQDAIDWIREVFEAGGGEYMDVASIHTYTHSVPEDFYSNKRATLIQDTRALLDEFGYTDMKISVSEMGWTTPSVVAEEGQGGYMVRWLVMTYDQLDTTYLYVSQEKNTESSHENGFGFIRAWTKEFAGDYPTYSAKPSFLALANYNNIMTDAVLEKELEKTTNGIHMYQFRLRDGKRAAIVWNASNEKETVTLKLDTDTAVMYDIVGNDTLLSPTRDGRYTLDVAGNPVYIVGDFTTCERAETEFFNLTDTIEITEGDIAYIRFKNNSDKKVRLDLSLPDNITESSRTDEQIRLNAGENSKENEKVYVRVVDDVTNTCYYEYKIPVEYKDKVTYTLKPSYFRDGYWQCVLELKNNMYSKSISGEAIIKEPLELSGQSKKLKFNNLGPRDVKLLRVNVPKDMSGAHLDLLLDLKLSDGEIYENVKNDVYLAGIVQMKSPPAIDGVLEKGEWDKSMPMLLNKQSQIVNEPTWTGTEDLSAKIYCAYDKDNFYLAAEIEDDILCDKDDLSRAWAVDGIQLAFAANNTVGASRTEYGIARVNGEPLVQRYYYIGLMEGIIGEVDVNVFEGVEFNETRSGTKNYYEVKVPWNQIYGKDIDVSETEEIYFAVAVNENDGTGRTGGMEYALGGILAGKYSECFIPVTLSK